jgi:hypothetical protein
MKRTRRSAELVTEAIRLARARQPHAEISGSRWQASTAEVRNWALNAGFGIGADGSTRSKRSPHTTRHIPATRTEPHGATNAATPCKEKSGNATYPVTIR